MTSLTYFLIDDDEDDREIFRLAIEELHPSHKCVTCKNGNDAIAALQDMTASLPSCIFIDINMPVMNGKDCLSEIKKLRHLAEVPVYMYSTSSDMRDKNEFFDLGARDIIKKPCKIADLVPLLKSVTS